MPLFGSKFSPKKIPLRKLSTTNLNDDLDELMTDDKMVVLELGGQRLIFQDGDWVPDTGVNATQHKSNQKLKKRLQELEEENNLLRLKYIILLNMLTQTTAESHLQEKELEKLKNN